MKHKSKKSLKVVHRRFYFKIVENTKKICSRKISTSLFYYFTFSLNSDLDIALAQSNGKSIMLLC